MTAPRTSTPVVSQAAGRGARPYPLVADSIDALFTRQARSTPAAAAFDDGTTAVTYAALEGDAARMTTALAGRGLKPGSRVAVCMRRGPELLATLVAILKVGAAYVPIDAAYPRPRVKTILDDAQPHLIVVDRTTRDRIGSGFPPIVLYDELLATAVADTSFAASSPGTIAYVMYTSGSTGAPKGVCISHRAIATRVINTDYVAISPDDRVAFASNVSFDAATFEIWSALLNGATLVPFDSSDLLVPERLSARITETQVSVLFVTPAVFNTVASEIPHAFAPLRVLMFGGEAANPSAVRRVLAAGPPEILMNVYGPTECTTFATTYRVTTMSEDALTVPIGTPIAYTDAYVLDSAGNPVSAGDAGELFLGGEGLADGYFGNAGLTAERFVTGPFDTGRLYRTGDRCRWRPDGQLEFVGRIDRQIKLRGFRIEPSEIEAVLLRLPQIANAVVEAIGEHAEEKRLVAYVSPMAGCWPDPAALRTELRRHLPSYMVPSDFVIAETLPLNANGKVDRTILQGVSLPAPGRRAVVGARDALEDELLRIWQDVLDVAPIGIDDDFFEIGGHSLKAAAMVARVAEAFSRPVPLSLLLENPTLAGFADALVSRSRENTTDVVTVRADGRRPPLFFLHGDFNGGGLYCMRLARGLTAQPFYALEPLGCRSADGPASIEAMAAQHAAAIRRVHPHGPYLLGGHCNGALEALEIARQFRDDGEQVPGVVLIQPPVIDSRLSAVDLPLRIASQLTRLEGERRVNLYLQVSDAMLQMMEQPAATPGIVIATLRNLARSGNGEPSTHAAGTSGEAPAARHDAAVWRRYTRAVAAYVPRRYDGSAGVFLAEEAVDGPHGPVRGWQRVGKGFEFHVVRGGHLSCLTTHVASTSAAIDRYLESVAGHD